MIIPALVIAIVGVVAIPAFTIGMYKAQKKLVVDKVSLHCIVS